MHILIRGDSSEILTTSSSLSAEPVRGWVQEHAAAARGRGRLLGSARYAKVVTITGCGLMGADPSASGTSKMEL